MGGALAVVAAVRGGGVGCGGCGAAVRCAAVAARVGATCRRGATAAARCAGAGARGSTGPITGRSRRAAQQQHVAAAIELRGRLHVADEERAAVVGPQRGDRADRETRPGSARPGPR